MRTIEDLLRAERLEILEEAARGVARLERYRLDGERTTRERLEALYVQVEAAVERRSLSGIVSYSATVARERHEAGFDFLDLLTAFSVLEGAIHRRTIASLPPEERALGLGLVGTAFAHGKRSLGQAYAAATGPALDLTPLFTGAYCDADGRCDAVHPV
jgi:hypothetical protein